MGVRAMADEQDLDHGNGSEPAEPHSPTEQRDGEPSAQPLNGPRILKVIKDKLSEIKRGVRAAEKYEEFKNATRRWRKRLVLTQPQIDGIANGDLRLYARGKFLYGDTFGDIHQTEIIYFFDIASGRYVAIYSDMD